MRTLRNELTQLLRRLGRAARQPSPPSTLSVLNSMFKSHEFEL